MSRLIDSSTSSSKFQKKDECDKRITHPMEIIKMSVSNWIERSRGITEIKIERGRP